jgi:predicted MFS family arabinose efflux permease
VPLLLRFGLAATWEGLGVLSLALTLLAWTGWPTTARQALVEAIRSKPRLPASLPVKALCVEYGLNAVGLVPHMIFLVDFVARGLGQGLAAGARYWIVFGLGAVTGPLLAGWTADRVGFRAALRLAFLVQAVAVALIAVTDRPLALLVSSAVVGAFVPGIVPITLGRVQELVAGQHERAAVWSWCTVAFALGQAGAAYAFSYAYAQSDGAHGALFIAGAAALLAAFAIDLVAARPAVNTKP